LLFLPLLWAGCDDTQDKRRTAAASLPPPPLSASASGPWAQTETTVAFAKKLVGAANARDAAKKAALYAEDATTQLAGDDPDRGRTEIQKDDEGQYSRFKDTKTHLGRVWVGRTASVIEYTWTGTRRAGELRGTRVGERPVGLNAAIVVAFDGDGLVKTERDYFDLATNLGQVEPRLLPTGFDRVRPAAAAATPPAGADVLEAKGTPEESANLDVMNKVYLAFDAHAIEDALAFYADDFVQEDFTAPGPQKKADVRKHATAVLAAIPDFKCTRVTVLPAGADVVVESSVQGTFTGPMGPIKPTGQPVNVHQLDVWRLSGGKIVKQWSYSNDLEVLTQLGIMKAAAPSPTASGASPAGSAPTH
jgi:ketosteroid isomerase-like protein